VGSPGRDDLLTAAALTARYADLAATGPARVKVLTAAAGHPRRDSIITVPATEVELTALRVGGN